MCSTKGSSEQLNDDETELLLKAGYIHIEGTLMPQPISRPQFTVTELRSAIPVHCFERSTVKSFGYLTLDILMIISLLCCAYAVLELQSLPLYGELIAYPVYWFIQGSFLFGIWVLAHECGKFKSNEKYEQPRLGQRHDRKIIASQNLFLDYGAVFQISFGLLTASCLNRKSH